MSRVLFTVVLAAVIFTASAHADCGDHSTCYGCTNADSGDCGFDYTTNTCVKGDPSTGYPSGYGYTPTWWAWKTDRCCDQHYSCTGCTQVTNTACAWNPNQNDGGSSVCQYSDIDDGDDSTISNEWQCPSQLNCDYNYDCSSCLDSTNCGWDRNEQTCNAGTSDGPYSGWSYSWHYYNCPDRTWSFRWSAGSMPMWFTIFGVFGCCFCICACTAGRRRRRVLCEQSRQATTIGNTNAASAAPLMGQPVYQQPPAPAMYGAGAAYTTQPAATGGGYGTAAAPVNAVAPFPAPGQQAINLYGPADDTPQVEDCATKP